MPGFCGMRRTIMGGAHVSVRWRLACCALAVVAASGTVQAREARQLYSIDDALHRPRAEAKLSPDVRLYFGNRKHPRVTKTLGEWTASKKVNVLRKSDRQACERAFLSAVLDLQQRAMREGGNAVIRIRSDYRGTVTSSETQFVCGTGGLTAGVALKGTVVRLAR